MTQNAFMKCFGCGRPMVSRTTPAAVGVVQHVAGGRCKTCWRATRAKGKFTVDENTAHLETWLAERRQRLATHAGRAA